MRIIAYYMEVCGLYLPTKKVASEELKKNLIPAKFLAENYTKKEIMDCIKLCAEKYGDVTWNLTTVKKQMPYVNK